jgi:hypothetical protein
MSDNKTKAVKRRVLTDTHKHRGKPCAKGEIIEVSENTAKRLDDAKITEPVK